MASKQQQSNCVEWTESFDTRIYPLKALQQAMNDYASLGTFTMKEEAGKMQVKALIPAENDFHFREEFSNYALGMVFKCR